MDAFIAQYCHKNDNKINRDMFERKFDKPLVEYILNTCKNLESIPAIKLKSWEFITDQTKIRSIVNKNLAKDPKIKNNKALERIVQRNRTIYDLLILHFQVQAKGRTAQVTRKVRIPKQFGAYFIRNGKKVILIDQVVDNSTFVKGNVLNYKTELYAVRLSTIKSKIEFIDGETANCPVFRIDLFTKVINPLFYFLARYGIQDTIEKFSLDNVMCITSGIINEYDYLYIKVKPGVYIEIHEKAFNSHPIIPYFVATLYDALSTTDNLTFKNVYNRDFWLKRLSFAFSEKATVEKGFKVLISFIKIMDKFALDRLKIKRHHKRNSFTVIRWMMTNYPQLLQKDSDDLKNKRVRGNETQAYYFNKYITRNTYSLLNTQNPPFDKYIKLLNSIGENTVIRSTQGTKDSPNSLFRYERYNDFDAIDLSRYSLKGPTGLNGGKTKTSMRYRAIYDSHYGRYDVNVCSSDPGLTGYLTGNVKLDESGYFSTEKTEPDEYDPVIYDIVDDIADPDYIKTRTDYIKGNLAFNEKTGYTEIRKHFSATELIGEFHRNPEKYGLVEDGQYLKFKTQPIDISDTKMSKKSKAPEYDVDESGKVVISFIKDKSLRPRSKYKIPRPNK